MPQHVTTTRIDFDPLDIGHNGSAPIHRIALAATRNARNVVFVDGEISAYPGEVRIHGDPVDGTFDVIGLAQYFLPPYTEGDPIVIVTRRKVQLYLIGTDQLVDITPTGWVATSWAPHFQIANDGALVIANGQKPWYFKTAIGDSQTAPPKATELGGLRVLGNDGEPLVWVNKAFTVGKLGPYMLLGRTNEGKSDAQWVPNRWRYSDINDAQRWFTGFAPDEEGLEGAQPSIAGFDDLPATNAHETPHILAFTSLREFAHMWENHNVWNLQVSGIPGVPLAKRLVHPGFGLLTPYSVASVGDRDYVWASDRLIYEFNGLDRQEISVPIRNDLAKLVNAGATARVYAYVKHNPREVVFAFPSIDTEDLDAPDLAACFNLENRTWSFREHPFTSAANLDRTGVVSGFQPDAATTWATVTGTWGSYIDTTWGDLPESIRNTGLAIADVEVLGSDDSRIYRRDGWLGRGANARTCYWWSAVTDFGDASLVKHLSALEVDLAKQSALAHEAQVPAESYDVSVYIKASDDPGVDWTSLAVKQTLTYTLGSASQRQKLDCRVSGRYFQIGISATSTAAVDSPAWSAIAGTWAAQTLTWRELGQQGQVERPWTLRRLAAHVLPRGLR